MITGEIFTCHIKCMDYSVSSIQILFEQQMYPTLNGKTSIHKSLDDSDRPQTHIISPGMSDKGKLVGGVSFYSQPTRSLIVSFRSYSA